MSVPKFFEKMIGLQTQKQQQQQKVLSYRSIVVDWKWQSEREPLGASNFMFLTSC